MGAIAPSQMIFAYARRGDIMYDDWNVRSSQRYLMMYPVVRDKSFAIIDEIDRIPTR